MAFSDSFTDTNGTDLPTHNSNWGGLSASTLNGMSITSNAVYANNSSGNSWTGTTWANDQYSQATVVALPDQNWAVVVRGDATLHTFYAGGIDPGNLGHNRYALWKWINDVRTLLTVHGSTSMTAGDVVRLEVSGTSLTLKVNGSTLIGPITDSDIASGNAGITAFNLSAGVAIMDDWSGDALSAGTTITPPVGSGALSGVSGRNDRALFTRTTIKGQN